MYRFRSINNLIGEFQELEKQEIYCAALEQLNDPMEGYIKYYCKGDKIIWVNFLKHYLLCLNLSFIKTSLMTDEDTFSKDDIPVFVTFEKLPSEEMKNLVEDIYEDFFRNSTVKAFIDFLANNPYETYFKDLAIYLKIFSMYGLESILKMQRISDKKYTRESNKINIPDNLSKVIDELNYNPEFHQDYETIMDVIADWTTRLDYLLLERYKDYPKTQTIFINFSSLYLEAIKDLTYPKAYLACFMTSCTNSSIWGSYGDNHKGACLKFKTGFSNPKLRLKTVVGYSLTLGNHYAYRDFNLYQVKYESKYDEMDFFRNLGRPTIADLKSQWYFNANGEMSICGEDILNNEEEWRNKYWENYENLYLKKLPAWAHENEYRIILSNALDDYLSPKDRLLEYEFTSLESITFGMRTPLEDKQRVIDIIKEKCKQNNVEEFEFYEMNFSNANGELYPKLVYKIGGDII